MLCTPRDEPNIENLNPKARGFEFKGSKIGVLLIHGLTASPTEMRPVGEWLAEQGYSVRGIRLPGHGTTPEELSRTPWTEWVEHAKKEARDFAQTVDQLFIVGLSAGTMISLEVSKEPEIQEKLIGCILISPALKLKPLGSKLSGILKHVVKFVPKPAGSREYFEEHDLQSYLVYPLAAINELRKLQKKVRNDASSISVPLLVALGDQDDTVDNPSMEKFVANLESRGIPVDIIHLPNSGHIATVEPDAEQLRSSILNWIEQRLSQVEPNAK